MRPYTSTPTPASSRSGWSEPAKYHDELIKHMGCASDDGASEQEAVTSSAQRCCPWHSEVRDSADRVDVEDPQSILDNRQRVHDSRGGIFRLCLEKQHDSRLSTNLERVLGYDPMPHEIPCRGLHLVLLEELQHALPSDAVGEPGVGDETHR